jgi:hypothetical protein
MKPTQVHGIYLTKKQHFQGHVNWLVKDLEAWDWLCGYWVSDEFRAMSEQNRMSKDSVNRYGVDRHICKTQRMLRKTYNFNSQLLHN